MKKILTSFGFGPHAAYLEAVLPTFRRYAYRHGYDMFLPSGDWFSWAAREWPAFAGMGGRPFSWWKLPLFHHLLHRAEYDVVLWLDADVCVCRFDADIADDLWAEGQNQLGREAAQGLVLHQVDVGSVPNCGVWAVTRKFLPWVPAVWDKTEFVNHGWWEQAAVMSLMGTDPNARPCLQPLGGTELRNQTAFLPYEWNPHVKDRLGVPPDARFKHATMFPDRLGTLRGWATEAMNGG